MLFRSVVGTLLDVRDLELAEDWERMALARRAAGCRRERGLTPRKWSEEKARAARHADDLRRMYRAICSSAALDDLVTISAYSAESIRVRTGTSALIHELYAPEKERAAPEPFTWPGIDPGREPFALVMNAGREEKNAAGAVAAFDRLFSDAAFVAAHPDLKVVITGIARIEDVGIDPPVHAGRFVALPHLPSARLEYLLSRARFLAYVSFNEGFGYPPLEAMHHGTPSLVGNNTSVPEVCGAAAVWCDPFDLASIEEGIRAILAAPPSAEAMRRRFEEVSARQRGDMARLAGMICRPADAARIDRGSGDVRLARAA